MPPQALPSLRQPASLPAFEPALASAFYRFAMASHQERRLPQPSRPAPSPADRDQRGQEGPDPEEGPAPSTAAPSKKRSREGLRAGGSGKKYRRHAKPPYSFLALIALAIQGSAEKKLRLADVSGRGGEGWIGPLARLGG